MSTHAELPFTVDAFEERTTEIPDDAPGPPAGRAVLRKTYTGALAGTATVEMLTTRGEGGAAYLAQERIVGTLEGRSGSFVLQHGAHTAPPSQWAFVVGGSGTGELAGIAGTGSVAHGLLTLDYELPG